MLGVSDRISIKFMVGFRITFWIRVKITFGDFKEDGVQFIHILFFFQLEQLSSPHAED